MLINLYEGEDVDIISENGETIFKHEGSTYKVDCDGRDLFDYIKGEDPIAEKEVKGPSGDFKSCLENKENDEHFLL